MYPAAVPVKIEEVQLLVFCRGISFSEIVRALLKGSTIMSQLSKSSFSLFANSR
jgi:hypothetical protein